MSYPLNSIAQLSDLMTSFLSLLRVGQVLYCLVRLTYMELQNQSSAATCASVPPMAYSETVRVSVFGGRSIAF
jgi:hypothetical protein